MDSNVESKGTPFSNIFWTISGTEKRQVIDFEIDKLIDFCSKELGFYNLVDYSGNYSLVRVFKGCIIQEARIEDLKHELKNYLRNEIGEEDVYAEFAKKNRITEHLIHLLEKLPESNFNISKENEAYFFYENGVVCVSPKGFNLIPYEEFKGTVWKGQIIKRNYIFEARKLENSEFHKFLINVSGKDVNRFWSLISILGYLLHPFKDPALSKAVIFIDEKVDFSGEAFGGTGKSLIAKAISFITPTVWKDGKKFNSKETFGNDDIRPFHRVLYYDDVKKGFDFEDFFPLITGEMTVNRKYKDSTKLPFHLTPKLLITSNYMVKGTGGSADERRRLEFEIAPHYTTNYTPLDEFGHRLFDDWNINQWQLFDNLMLRCVNYYMNKGIVPPPQINLKVNKLKMATDPDFIVFMDDTIELDITYDKSTLIDTFRQLSPSNRFLTANTFKKWIDVWADGRAYKPIHTKSNGNYKVRFEML
jgi:hypothetical protein